MEQSVSHARMAIHGLLRRPLFREPLLYFLLVGTAAFAVDHASRTDDRIIRITPSVRSEIARSLQARLGRPAQADELQPEIERWKQEEALYREGLKMRLLEKDTVVRSRIAVKLMEIGRTRNVLPQPTEAELRAYLEQHRDGYTLLPTYDFEQVYVSETRSDARAYAHQLLLQLRAGASPDGLGDHFPRGWQFTRESLSRILPVFGEQAAQELPRYPVGEWNMVKGLHGYHALRVTRVESGQPDFAKLREILVMALNAERQESAAQAFAREIERRYRFVSTE